MAPLLTVAVAVLGVAVLGCGDSEDDAPAAPAQQSASASDEQRVRSALDELGAHLADGDSAAACEMMSETVAKRLAAAGQSCEKVYESLFEGRVAEDFDPEVLSVKVDGDRAVVLGKSSHDPKPGRAILVKEGGDWKVETWFTNQ